MWSPASAAALLAFVSFVSAFPTVPYQTPTVTPEPYPTPTVTPGSYPTPTLAFTWNAADSQQTHCGKAVFSKETKLASADWRDCAALYSAWAVENGTFAVAAFANTANVPILRSGSCTLSITGVEQGEGPYYVGDADVQEILHKALLKYSDGMQLAAQRQVDCLTQKAVNGSAKAGLFWQISATDA